MNQTSSAIETEIVQRLGFVPPFFHPARQDPHVLGELWCHTCTAYLDNPLPELFKEKLTALLSRHCAVPYCLMCHSASMRPLGVSGGELLELLETKNIFLAAPKVRVTDDAAPWTHPGSSLEAWVLACSEAIFLHIDWQRAQALLRDIVGDVVFNRVLTLISYVRACLDWISAHPEVRHDEDARVKLHMGPLVAEEPQLALFFARHGGSSKSLTVRWMDQDNLQLMQELQRSNSELKQREESIRRLMDATPCIVWETDARGKAAFFNAAWYHYTRRALQSSMGTGAIVVVHPDQRAAYLSLWRQHHTASSEFETVLQLLGGDGKYRWFLVRVAPVRDASQRPQKWLGTAVDIEGIKVESSAASRQAALLQSAVSLGGVGFFDWNILEDKFDFSERFKQDWQVQSGISLEEVIGRVHPEDSPSLRLLLNASLLGNEPYETTYRIIRPDGSLAWIEAQGSTTYDSQGRAVRFFGTTINVTERMREREAAISRQRWIEAILDEMPGPVLMFDPDSRMLTFSNKAARAMFGGPIPENLEDCRIYGPEPESESASLRPNLMLEQAASGVCFDNAAMVWETPAGAYDILISTAALPSLGGHPAVILCSLRDITALKKTEADLKSVVEALETQNALRRRFVSALSHDLRAPIAVGLMSSQLIARKGAADAAYVLKACRRIESSMTRADRMIRDLLDASRIEAGQKIALNFAPAQMDALLIDAAAELNQIYNDCVAFCNRAGTARGTWDASAIRRVVDNLVANAVKYGQRNSVVTLTLSQHAGCVELQVHNQGHAIAPEDQERLFAPYARAQSAIESGQQGWGIGLAVVKEIVSLHGGEVGVESFEGIGTTFSVKLPMDSSRESILQK